MGENSESPTSHDVIRVIEHATRDELMSLKVTLGPKRLIVAMCENDRGRFIKLAEGRARIIVPADGIPQMRQALNSLEANVDLPSPLHDTDHSSGPASVTTSGEDTKSDLIASQRFLSEGRKFYLDILENARGRYLKISQSSIRRITIIAPLGFITLLKRAITMLVDKVPPDTSLSDPTSVQRTARTIERTIPLSDGETVSINVVQREIRVMGKRVIFESGANRRGSYIKISESSGAQRMSVMLPHSTVPEIIQLLQEVVDEGDPADAISAAQNGE